MNSVEIPQIFPSFPDQRISDRLTERLMRLLAQLDNQMQRFSDLDKQDAEIQLQMLRGGMSDIAALIARTRTEVAGLIPQGTAPSRIAAASGELDAVVDTTEQAAEEIMNAAEHIQQADAKLRAMALPPEAAAELDAIEDAASTVFTACGFQDLTGQRIRKVVAALNYVEARVASLRDLWADPSVAPPAEDTDTRPDAHLLNGPSSDGLDQDQVDKLFN